MGPSCTCGTSGGTQVASEGAFLHLWRIWRHTWRIGGGLPAPVAHRAAHSASEGAFLHLWDIGRHTGSIRGGVPAPVGHREAHRSRRRGLPCTCGTSGGAQVAAEGASLHLWRICRHTCRGGEGLPAPVGHRTAHRSRRRGLPCTCGAFGGTQVALEGVYLHLWDIGRHRGCGGEGVPAPVAHWVAHMARRKGWRWRRKGWRWRQRGWRGCGVRIFMYIYQDKG